MSSPTHATPTSGVFDSDLDMQSLPPPVQYPRARVINQAQIPGYLPDTEDTKVLRLMHSYSLDWNLYLSHQET